MNATSENLGTEQLTQGAITAFNHWRADAMPQLQTILQDEPSAPLANCVKGIVLATGRNTNYQGMIDECLAHALAGQASMPVGQRPYVDALQSLATGQLQQAVTVYEGILAQSPSDLFVHRLVQQELFWMGEARWMADVVEKAAPAWSADSADYGMLLSVRAFSLEEAGDRERAEGFAREAVERDATDYWGTHAVAHVLEMQARVDEGIAWLKGLSANWQDGNQIVHHLWWHLCLFLLERGAHEEILELFDTQVRNLDSPMVQSAPDVYIDIQNAASLLQRLELRGVEVGDRWNSVSEAAAQRIGNHASAFTDSHAVMILAALGQWQQAQALIDSMCEFAAHSEGSLGPRYKNAGIPAARAALAHRRGDYQAVADNLLPARRGLWQMGGSHAQRDIYTQLLVDALMKLDDRLWLSIIIDEMNALPFDKLPERTLYADAVVIVQ